MNNQKKPTNRQDSGSKKVVVGVTGRLDSMVAAYLLKKQGFDITCIGIQFHSKEKEKAIAEKFYRHDDPDNESEYRDPAPFLGVSIIDNLIAVKELCEKIGLTFYAVDASGEYQDIITDKLVAAKIGGLGFSPNVYVTKLIFDILLQKSKKLNADFISTGHYAKVVKNHSTKSYNIFVANDVRNDQSQDFCLLGQEVLSKVILPFSEMRKMEVEKIGGQILNLPFIQSRGDESDILTNPDMPLFAQERSPQVMIKEGVIIDHRTDTVITDHEGIHHFHHGMTDLKTKSGLPIDKSIAIVDIVYGSGTALAGLIEDLSVEVINLKNVYFQGEIDVTKPIGVYLRVKRSDELLRGTLFFNNNTFCHIELESTFHGLLIRGEFVSFYNKKGVSGRLIGGGEVLKAGEIENGQFFHLPREEDYGDDQPEIIVDVHKFKF